jgi:hypothetical protein
VKLFIEFIVVPSPVDTNCDFRAAYRSENFPLIYDKLVLPFGQHPRLTAVKQDWATADVCAVRRSTYLQSGFFVVFPDSRHLLVSSEILGTQILRRLQSICCQLPCFAHVTNRPIIPGLNHIFCPLFIYVCPFL